MSGAVESIAGRVLRRLYLQLPLRRRLLGFVVRMEGGQYRSASLRKVLQRFHGVSVGIHTYGSLLDPGMCDPFTTIGSYVSIGPNVRRFGASHPIDSLSMHPYWYNPALGYVGAERDVERTECVIEDEVWIGANVTILPGCRRVGMGAVIGAGSVVTRDVPEFTVVAGNPASILRTRLSPAQRQALKARSPAFMDPSVMLKMIERDRE